MVDNAHVKRASIDSSWLRLIDAVSTVMEVAEASNSRTLPSFHFPRQHNTVRGSSIAYGSLFKLSSSVSSAKHPPWLQRQCGYGYWIL
ncbi:hypothetical protein Tco_1089433, partial [Tanacetum coccineum]